MYDIKEVMTPEELAFVEQYDAQMAAAREGYEQRYAEFLEKMEERTRIEQAKRAQHEKDCDDLLKEITDILADDEDNKISKADRILSAASEHEHTVSNRIYHSRFDDVPICPQTWGHELKQSDSRRYYAIHENCKSRIRLLNKLVPKIEGLIVDNRLTESFLVGMQSITHIDQAECAPIVANLLMNMLRARNIAVLLVDRVFVEKNGIQLVKYYIHPGEGVATEKSDTI